MMFQKEFIIIQQVHQKNTCFVIIGVIKISVINLSLMLVMVAWYIIYSLWVKKLLNVKSVDYRCVLWGVTKNEAINMLNNSELDDKGILWIWILVQIKHLSKELKNVHFEELISETFLLMVMTILLLLMVQKVMKRIWWVGRYWSEVLLLKFLWC